MICMKNGYLHINDVIGEKVYVNGCFKYKDHPRLGRMCVSKYAGPDNSRSRDSTLTIQGAKLFNAMQKNIRNLKNIPVDKFKNALDKHLQTIPDEPQIRGYTGCRRVWLKLNLRHEISLPIHFFLQESWIERRLWCGSKDSCQSGMLNKKSKGIPKVGKYSKDFWKCVHVHNEGEKWRRIRKRTFLSSDARNLIFGTKYKSPSWHTFWLVVQCYLYVINVVWTGRCFGVCASWS